MPSLLCEVLFSILFLYCSVSTFSAEFFDGLLRSFLCVFGVASIQETEGTFSGISLFYYSYVILLSLIGNVMFLVSFLIYGPIWFRTYTQFTQKRMTEAGETEVVSPHNQVIFCRRRRLSHICVFTRYDLYATLVLLFIGAQLLVRGLTGNDDFKDIEGMLFRKTIDKYDGSRTNATCLDNWCDDVYGEPALKAIHSFQQEMQCCGWDSARDWTTASTFKHCPRRNLSLPKSCCRGMAEDCWLRHEMRFTISCNEFEHPIRSIIDPTQYSNHCFGLYPLYKLIALISYQFSFKKLFDGSALLLRVNLFFPSTVKIFWFVAILIKIIPNLVQTLIIHSISVQMITFSPKLFAE